VSWGPLNNPYLAYTCWHYFTYIPNDPRMYESDTRVATNAGVATFSCDGSGFYDLESIVTHEWGHAYGLDDLSSAYHYNLTMSASVNYCDTRHRTLGLGDYRGLRQLYGFR
jgi:hypothetical protein